jgi:hypothetical protein
VRPIGLGLLSTHWNPSLAVVFANNENISIPFVSQRGSIALWIGTIFTCFHETLKYLSTAPKLRSGYLQEHKMLGIIDCYGVSNQTPQLITRDQSTNKLLFLSTTTKVYDSLSSWGKRSTRNDVLLVDEDYGRNRSPRETPESLLSGVYGEIVDDCSNPKKREVK